MIKRLFTKSGLTMQGKEEGDKGFATFVERPDHAILRFRRQIRACYATTM